MEPKPPNPKFLLFVWGGRLHRCVESCSFLKVRGFSAGGEEGPLDSMEIYRKQ